MMAKQREDRFEVSTRFVGGRAVVSLSGELDMCAVEAIAAAVSKALALSSRLTIDLRQASFLDGAIVSSVLAARRQARQADAQLELHTANERVMRPFRLLGLGDVLEALASSSRTRSQTHSRSSPVTSMLPHIVHCPTPARQS